MMSTIQTIITGNDNIIGHKKAKPSKACHLSGGSVLLGRQLIVLRRRAPDARLEKTCSCR